MDSLKDISKIADSLPTTGKLNCKFDPAQTGSSKGILSSSKFIPAPLDRSVVEGTVPPQAYNDPVTQALLIAFDSQVAVGGPSASLISAKEKGIYSIDFPEMSKRIEGSQSKLELDSDDFENFAKVFADTILKPATYTELNNSVSSQRALGITKEKNLSRTFKKYYQAYIEGEYIDRTGTKFKKPEIKKSIGNDTISAALSIFLDALGDTYVSMPILKKKVSKKKVLSKSHMDMVALKSENPGTFAVGFSTWEREGFKLGDSIKVSDTYWGQNTNDGTYKIIKLEGPIAQVEPSPKIMNPDTSFRIEVDQEDISYIYFPHQKNEQPTAAKEKIVLEIEASTKSDECGITEPEAKAIGFLSGLAGEKSSLLSGFVLEHFGDLELAFGIGGHFSVGDNETLATIVKTFFEVGSRRAVERGAYEFFYAYSYKENSSSKGSLGTAPIFTFFDPSQSVGQIGARPNPRYQEIAKFLEDFYF